MDHKKKLEKSQAKKDRCRLKEFKRGKNINEAFDTLQQHIPFLRADERKSLSKIKALRLAKKYIEHLTQLAEGNQMADPLSNETRSLELTDFRQVVTGEMRSRNSYRERAFSEEMEPEAVQRILTREQSRRRFPMEVKALRLDTEKPMKKKKKKIGKKIVRKIVPEKVLNREVEKTETLQKVKEVEQNEKANSLAEEKKKNPVETVKMATTENKKKKKKTRALQKVKELEQNDQTNSPKNAEVLDVEIPQPNTMKLLKKRKASVGDNVIVKKKKRTEQYGSENEFRKKTTLPTKKEMRFFKRYAELSTDPQLRRQNAVYSSLEPMRLSHSGYSEKDGFYVTYANVDGGVIVNMIASQMQSNKELRLDESFGVTMNVFTKASPSPMVGRGPRKMEKLRNDILVSFATREMKQLALARDLLEEAGMDTDKQEHGRDDLLELVTHLADYQIILWGIHEKEVVATDLERFNENGRKFIGLFYQNGHYEFCKIRLPPRK
ncbi:hypothetical protein B9Z55_015470 [Caenorhabditis nigoni]|uniref:BHLH domain-containing protein n=1 Tax=Caenorhabditis nigoni TaxID=1611254 RepID=A0A2G5UAD1_9PELO|nr:hypothetical protein B9Z55_015470 [Caenorhabditis nigoni]